MKSPHKNANSKARACIGEIDIIWAQDLFFNSICMHLRQIVFRSQYRPPGLRFVGHLSADTQSKCVCLCSERLDNFWSYASKSSASFVSWVYGLSIDLLRLLFVILIKFKPDRYFALEKNHNFPSLTILLKNLKKYQFQQLSGFMQIVCYFFTNT